MKKLLAALLFLILPAFAQARALKVVSVEGRSLVSGRQLEAGATLKPGARVQLASGARLLLSDGAGGAILVKGPATFTPQRWGLSVAAGSVLSRLAKLKERFQIRTPAAVASVRGTTFYIEARGALTAYVCLCEGSLNVSRFVGSRFSADMQSTHHKSALFKFTDVGGVQSESEMVGHDDDEIKQLERIVADAK